jgi:hypothetical protein
MEASAAQLKEAIANMNEEAVERKEVGIRVWCLRLSLLSFMVLSLY